MKKMSLAVPAGFRFSLVLFFLFQCCARQSLAQLKESAKEYNDVAMWLKDLGSPDEYTKYAAALSLNSLGANKDSGLAKLLAATRSADPYIRQYTAYALSNFQYKPALCLPVLMTLLNDDIKRVRQIAALAAARFGNTAIPYLLTAAADTKGKPSLDATGVIEDNNKSMEIQLAESWKQSDIKDEHINITRVNLNAIIALRNLLAGNLLPAIQSRKSLPVFEKNIILEPYGYQYEFTGWDTKVDYQKMFFKPIITPIKPDSEEVKKQEANDGLTVDIMERGIQIDTGFLQRMAAMADSLLHSPFDSAMNRNEIFKILTNHPSLYPQFTQLYISEIRRAAGGQCSPFLFTALYNAGASARELVPMLTTWLDTTKNHDMQKPLMYRCLVKILSGSSAKYRLTSKYFGSTSYEFPGDSMMIFGTMMKPYYFYFFNAHGLSAKENEKLISDDSLSSGPAFSTDFFKMMSDLKVDDQLVLEGSEVPDTPAAITDEITKRYVIKSLSDKDYKIRCMALQFCNYLDKIDFPVSGFGDNNLMVQHYFFMLDNVPGISATYPGFTSLKSRYELNKQLIELHNREMLDLFAGEGTYGIGGWGAGGTLTVLPKLPWPPPPASDRKLIDISGCTVAGKTVGMLYNKLKNALTGNANIPESCLRVYGAPDGFALITSIEQTDEEGVPLTGKDRWSKTVSAPGGWSGYFSSLLNGREGYFRSLAFIVCRNKNFIDNGSFVADATMFSNNMYNGGGVDLPDDMKQVPAAGFSMNVLIYKFYKKNGGVISTLKKDSNVVPAEEYLRPMNILNAFKN